MVHLAKVEYKCLDIYFSIWRIRKEVCAIEKEGSSSLALTLERKECLIWYPYQKAWRAILLLIKEGETTRSSQRSSLHS
jgi:hypothetical protein